MVSILFFVLGLIAAFLLIGGKFIGFFVVLVLTLVLGQKLNTFLPEPTRQDFDS